MSSADRHVPTLTEAAVRYAAAGWPVLPLHDTTTGCCSCRAGPECARPGRHPRTRRGFHDATDAASRVKAWWTRWPQANVAVPTGAVSGLVVIDCDGPEGVATWRHLRDVHPGTVEGAIAVTPHGRHVWYRLSPGVVVPRRIRALGAGIDVLGESGYALAAPSRAVCGRADRHGQDGCDGQYRWITTGLRPLPSWIADRLGREHPPNSAPPQPRRVAGSDDSYGQAALHGEVERVAGTPVGGRNATLNLAAYHLGRLVSDGQVDRAQAERALYDAAAACGLLDDDGPAAVQATIRSGLDGGALRRGRGSRREPSRITDIRVLVTLRGHNHGR